MSRNVACVALLIGVGCSAEPFSEAGGASQNLGGQAPVPGASGAGGSTQGVDPGTEETMGGAGGTAPAAPPVPSGANGGEGGAPVPPEVPSDDAGAPVPDPVGKTVAYVAGSSNDASAPGEGTGDKFLIERLEDELKHEVLLLPDSTPAARLMEQASSADLVIIAESTTSRVLQEKLRDVPTTVMVFEAFIQDEMDMTAKGPPGDPGLPVNFALGVKERETEIEILDSDHPLAAGLSGLVTVYSVEKSITWGTVGGDAQVIATLPGDPAGAAIYVYLAGEKLFDGSTAPGTRVGYFLEDDDETGTPNLMTEQGLQLFDAAIAWSLQN